MPKIILIIMLVLFETCFAFSHQCDTLFNSTEKVLTQETSARFDSSNRAENTTETFLSRQASLVQKMWTKTTGTSLDQSLDKIKESRSSKVQKTLEAFATNKFAINMVVPSSVRTEIAQKGFLSIHSTQISRGFSSVVGRTAIEAAFSGLSFSSYDRLAKKLKPKYAFWAPPVFGQKKAHYPKQYGDDIFTFKTDRLEDQMTFTIGDSLDYVSSKEVDEHITANTEDAESSTKSWINGVVHRAKSIFDVYIPFQYKDFLSLFVEYSNENQKLIQINGVGHESNPSLSNSPSVLKSFNLPRHLYSNKYIELQIWGDLDLSHVETFTFRNLPPSGAFLKALKKHHIKIYDGRNKTNMQRDRNDFDQDQIKLWDESNETGIYFDPQNYSDGQWVDPRVKFESNETLSLPGPESDFQSSTGGRWVQDSIGQHWFEKPDGPHSELQTSAEVISSRIYKLFGIETPETLKINRNGKYYTLSKYIGQRSSPSNLSELNSFNDKFIRVVAAYLKDWDRFSNVNNNRKVTDDRTVLIDFGGTLGSRAQGQFKSDSSVVSEAIGALDAGDHLNIYRNFKPDLPKSHPLMKITKADLAIIAEKLPVYLTDGALYDIVKIANFSNISDSKMMFEILRKRRDNLVSELLLISK